MTLRLDLNDVREHAARYRAELKRNIAELSRIESMAPTIIETMAAELETLRRDNAQLRAKLDRSPKALAAVDQPTTDTQ